MNDIKKLFILLFFFERISFNCSMVGPVGSFIVWQNSFFHIIVCFDHTVSIHGKYQFVVVTSSIVKNSFIIIPSCEIYFFIMKQFVRFRFFNPIFHWAPWRYFVSNVMFWIWIYTSIFSFMSFLTYPLT